MLTWVGAVLEFGFFRFPGPGEFKNSDLFRMILRGNVLALSVPLGAVRRFADKQNAGHSGQ